VATTDAASDTGVSRGAFSLERHVPAPPDDGAIEAAGRDSAGAVADHAQDPPSSGEDALPEPPVAPAIGGTARPDAQDAGTVETTEDIRAAAPDASRHDPPAANSSAAEDATPGGDFASRDASDASEPNAMPETPMGADSLPSARFDPSEPGAVPLRGDDAGGGDHIRQDTAILDEETLRRIIAEVVREELQGELGERITRNLRKLVRREIRLVLAADELD
jgi:hypothetical protein